MKCPYCSGEVPAQSISCPYCGRENPEGIAFQAEVRERIERNKLLKPFLIKQKTPELVQRMLTRIVIIIAVANVLLFVLAFGIYVWSTVDETREPMQGSYGEYYTQTFNGTNDYTDYFFWDYLVEVINRMDEGEMPDAEQLNTFTYYCNDALVRSQGTDDFEPVYGMLTAFFRGYLGLSEADTDFLEPNAEGEYEYMSRDEIDETGIMVAIEERLEEVH